MLGMVGRAWCDLASVWNVMPNGGDFIILLGMVGRAAWSDLTSG